MKDKCLSFLSAIASFIKDNKKVAIGILVAIVVVLLVIIIAANGGKPGKYEEKIKTATKALASESKMKKAIGDVIDVRGAAAWEEAGQDAEDFTKEYKNIKKNSDEAKAMEKALKHFAEINESKELKVSVKSIKEPKKSSKNKKIYTVNATIEADLYGSGSEEKIGVKFVFYKGKIIDIIRKSDDKSYFEQALKEYRADRKSSADDEE